MLGRYFSQKLQLVFIVASWEVRYDAFWIVVLIQIHSRCGLSIGRDQPIKQIDRLRAHEAVERQRVELGLPTTRTQV